jgi:hypothetical protein
MALPLTGLAAPVANLTGTWHLNTDKSRWGKRRKPVSVVVKVEHSEPVLKYSGVVVDANGESRSIAFDEKIDGKEYPAETASGPGKIVVSRVDANTLSVVLRSDDGRLVQTSRTSLSRDGKTLTRRMNLKLPDGEQTWTEIYEKQ